MDVEACCTGVQATLFLPPLPLFPCIRPPTPLSQRLLAAALLACLLPARCTARLSALR